MLLCGIFCPTHHQARWTVTDYDDDDDDDDDNDRDDDSGDDKFTSCWLYKKIY